MIRWLRRLTGQGVPPEFAGRLDESENVLAVAEVDGGGHLLATSLGLWLPRDSAASAAGAGRDASDDGAAGEVRRVGWHLISKAVWGGGAMSVIEAEERGAAGDAVLIADRPVRRFALSRPGSLPRVVHGRVTGSILSRHHHDLPGGGAWFVQRRVPGRGGPLLQVRADPGTDEGALVSLAAEVAARLRGVG